MVKRTVVTGGAGFLGSHLCRRLLREGHEVVCIDNFVTGSADNVAELLENPSFTLLRYDVTSFLHVAGRVDYVLHFASPASPIDYLELPIETLKVGSIGTLHALGLARDKGARFLTASTSEVYGDPQIHPQPESYWGHVNPIGPRGVYDEAKRFGEALVMAYRRTGKVDTAIVRIFNTHGPFMRAHDGRAVPTFIRQALANEPLTVAGDGTQTRSIIYVDDLIEGIWRLLVSGHPGPVNIGSPHETTMEQLARTIARLCGSRAGIRYVDRPVDDPTTRQPDISLAKAIFDWQPKIELEEGLRRTIDYFQTSLRCDPVTPSSVDLSLTRMTSSQIS